MSATFRFANDTANHATAASQAKYETIPRMSCKVLIKGNAIINTPNSSSRALFRFPNRGAHDVGFNKPSSDGVVRFYCGNTNDGYAQIAFSPALNQSVLDATAWYTLYAHFGGSTFGPNRYLAELFDASGTSIGVATNTTSYADLPGGGAGNGTLRVGNNSVTAHEWTIGGLAIYDAILTGSNRSSVPTTGDAGIVSLYIADAGSGTTIDDDTGGTALTISGSGTWTTESNPWVSSSGPENLKNWAPIWGDIWGDIWATDDDPAPSGPGFRGYYGACV
jgi:hypothetical protein